MYEVNLIYVVQVILIEVKCSYQRFELVLLRSHQLDVDGVPERVAELGGHAWRYAANVGRVDGVDDVRNFFDSFDDILKQVCRSATHRSFEFWSN